MAFARRTGRGLVFPLRRKSPELRTTDRCPYANAVIFLLNTNTPELFNPDVIAITTPECAAMRLTSAWIGKGARDLLWHGGLLEAVA
jgi:hypothetical protein